LISVNGKLIDIFTNNNSCEDGEKILIKNYFLKKKSAAAWAHSILHCRINKEQHFCVYKKCFYVRRSIKKWKQLITIMMCDKN